MWVRKDFEPLVEATNRRPALAILLLGAVLRHDELRFQGHNPMVPGRDQRRPHHGMVIVGLAGAPRARTENAASPISAIE